MIQSSLFKFKIWHYLFMVNSLSCQMFNSLISVTSTFDAIANCINRPVFGNFISERYGEVRKYGIYVGRTIFSCEKPKEASLAASLNFEDPILNIANKVGNYSIPRLFGIEFLLADYWEKYKISDNARHFWKMTGVADLIENYDNLNKPDLPLDTITTFTNSSSLSDICHADEPITLATLPLINGKKLDLQLDTTTTFTNSSSFLDMCHVDGSLTLATLPPINGKKLDLPIDTITTFTNSSNSSSFLDMCRADEPITLAITRPRCELPKIFPKFVEVELKYLDRIDEKPKISDLDCSINPINGAMAAAGIVVLCFGIYKLATFAAKYWEEKAAKVGTKAKQIPVAPAETSINNSTSDKKENTANKSDVVQLSNIQKVNPSQGIAEENQAKLEAEVSSTEETV